MRQRGNPLILPIHEILALEKSFYLIPGHTQQYQFFYKTGGDKIYIYSIHKNTTE